MNRIAWLAPMVAITMAVGAESSLEHMGLPIEGLTAAGIRDTFSEVHFGHAHEALDIPSPAGTPIHAVVAGTIQKLFLSKAGGNTIYEFDEDGVLCYYYAHLERYAAGVHDGLKVGQGTVIGYVGSTGDASPTAPHLHFAVFALGPAKQWWKGDVLNPYAALLAAAKRAPATR